MTAGADENGRLKRELGSLYAVGIGLGAVMGAGIFVVTGVAAGVGPLSMGVRLTKHQHWNLTRAHHGCGGAPQN
jgi:hypothetical protein